jgi:uncharacterized protein
MIKPVDQASRIDTLDVLRGFALAGVLVANMVTHTGYFFLSSASQRELDVLGTDGIVTWLEHFLVDGKFYSLFSLLFGIGFALQMKSHSQLAGGFTARFTRRLLVLFLFGLLHAIFFYVGDILTVYALTGLFLLLFRNASERTLIRTAVILMILPVIQYLFYWVPQLSQVPVENTSEDVGRPAFFDQLVEGYRNGTFFDIVQNNIGGLIFGRYPDLFFTGRFFRVLAMFLVGLYVSRTLNLNNLSLHREFLKKVLLWGAVIGIPCNIVLAMIMETGAYYGLLPTGIIQPLVYAFGVPALSLSYASAIGLLYVNRQSLLGVFAPVGQMALTNYLSQSVICCIIFMNYGFGNYAMFGPTILLAIAIAIFIFQIVFSHWWLKRFQFGPMEWLWRSMTYRKWQPIRRASVAVAS